MNADQLTTGQQAALLELLVLGMYADAHLALAEDERLREVLRRSGVPSEADQRAWIANAVTQVSRRAADSASRRIYLGELGRQFSGVTGRLSALGALQQLLAADGAIGAREKELLTELEEVWS